MSSTTKNELLHAASRMLLSKGLNGFSLQELATSLHIKKASLFHYYPSKLALAIDLYRFYQEAFILWTKDYEHLTPEKQMLAYVKKLSSWICDKERVCPVGALSLEWTLIEPELQIEIKKLHDLQREWLTKLFKQIQKENKMRISVSQATIGVMSLIQGSIQLARVIEDKELLNKNLRTYLKCIKD